MGSHPPSSLHRLSPCLSLDCRHTSLCRPRLGVRTTHWGWSNAFVSQTHTHTRARTHTRGQSGHSERALTPSLSMLELSNWPLFVNRSRVGGTLSSLRSARLGWARGAVRRCAGEAPPHPTPRVPAPPPPAPRAGRCALRPARGRRALGWGERRRGVGGLLGWRWRSAVQWSVSPAPYMVGD